MRFRPHSLALIAISSLLALFAMATVLAAQSERKVTKLADGVYEIQHRGGEFQRQHDGNYRRATSVRGRYLLSAVGAREDIAQIRQWTDKPVSFVLNTHFHNDHNLGNRAYMDAFPR